MANTICEGDRVIATANLGNGASKGTKGVVTHQSVHHGLYTVRFETGKEVGGVREHQIARA